MDYNGRAGWSDTLLISRFALPTGQHVAQALDVSWLGQNGMGNGLSMTTPDLIDNFCNDMSATGFGCQVKQVRLQCTIGVSWWPPYCLVGIA